MLSKPPTGLLFVAPLWPAEALLPDITTNQRCDLSKITFCNLTNWHALTVLAQNLAALHSYLDCSSPDIVTF